MSPAGARPSRVLWALLAFLALLVAAGAAALFHTDLDERALRQQGRQSNAILLVATRLQAELLTLESAQRNYLITHDITHLAPYDASRQRAAELGAQLAAITSPAGTGSKSTADFAALLGLSDDRMARTDAAIVLARTGQPEEALHLALSAQGESLILRFRTGIEDLLRRESAARDRAYALVDAAQRRKGNLLALLVAMAGIGVIAAARLIRAAEGTEPPNALLAELERQRDRADRGRRELSHRVKNLLAVVISIIGTTARQEKDPIEAARAGTRPCAGARPFPVLRPARSGADHAARSRADGGRALCPRGPPPGARRPRDRSSGRGHHADRPDY